MKNSLLRTLKIDPRHVTAWEVIAKGSYWTFIRTVGVPPDFSLVLLPWPSSSPAPRGRSIVKVGKLWGSRLCSFRTNFICSRTWEILCSRVLKTIVTMTAKNQGKTTLQLAWNPTTHLKQAANQEASQKIHREIQGTKVGLDKILRIPDGMEGCEDWGYAYTQERMEKALARNSDLLSVGPYKHRK